MSASPSVFIVSTAFVRVLASFATRPRSRVQLMTIRQGQPQSKNVDRDNFSMTRQYQVQSEKELKISKITTTTAPKDNR
ncbi:hypothetical protein QBC35DRAFT_494293 [Podospora australis]|uniref:Secreted protein n=1 Tax=Podospora australis TaxID=1536484 RepID=A0AAN6WW95_9PEZI|nr:hypothetical protein QBC35DRAFT_494293 [Podospora australis]